MDALIEQFFNLDIMSQALPLLLRGLLVTIGLTLVLAPLGMAAGLGLALASSGEGRWKWVARLWVNVFRALPPLVLIILCFTALPFLGIKLPAIVCVVLGLLLNNSAYYSEIFRAGLGAVPRGQLEAARSTGLGRIASLRLVQLPQAVRHVLPDLVSNTIEVFKSTSLAAVVSVTDLLYAASTARTITFNSSPLTLAAVIYLLLLIPAVRAITALEQRMRQQPTRAAQALPAPAAAGNRLPVLPGA